MDATSDEPEPMAGLVESTFGNPRYTAMRHIALISGGRTFPACDMSSTITEWSVAPARTVYDDIRCGRAGCAAAWRFVPSRRYGASEPAHGTEASRPGEQPRRDIVGQPTLLPTTALLSLPTRGGTAWGWRVTLDCGHTVERRARYRVRESADRPLRREAADVIPLSGPLRCEHCPSEN